MQSSTVSEAYLPYKFTNIHTGRTLHGFSKNPEVCRRKIISRLLLGTHGNRQLQMDFKFGGRAAFVFVEEPWAGEDTYLPLVSPEKRGLDPSLITQVGDCQLWEWTTTLYKQTARWAAVWAAYPEAIFWRNLPIRATCGRASCVNPEHLVFYYRQGEAIFLHAGSLPPLQTNSCAA